MEEKAQEEMLNVIDNLKYSLMEMYIKFPTIIDPTQVRFDIILWLQDVIAIEKSIKGKQNFWQQFQDNEGMIDIENLDIKFTAYLEENKLEKKH